ncbi:uncharacterized protein IUM83_11858 [Phytophthora cinnamomi]|uniref:uncharacterized protein n=1 Tax=Phytophthora cinnamomi TaxID=4785 RepID=UPI00355A6803|nr:hypothetical protein IUM83_11858 [Phytophthora cinnamomi]
MVNKRVPREEAQVDQSIGQRASAKYSRGTRLSLGGVAVTNPASLALLHCTCCRSVYHFLGAECYTCSGDDIAPIEVAARSALVGGGVLRFNIHAMPDAVFGSFVYSSRFVATSTNTELQSGSYGKLDGYKSQQHGTRPIQ